MRVGRAVQRRNQRPVAANFDQGQRFAPCLKLRDDVVLQRRVTVAVNVLAQAFHHRLLQLLQPFSILGRIVGQREREVHAAPAELRVDDHIGRHRDMVGQLLIDLRLAQAHEPHRQRAAGQPRAEAPTQERDQPVTHHRLQFTGRAGQCDDDMALRFEDQTNGCPVGVLQIRATNRDLRLPAQIGAQLLGGPTEAPSHGSQHVRVFLQFDAREFGQGLARDIVGGRSQPSGDEDQIGSTGRKAQRRDQIALLVVHTHRAGALQTQGSQRPREKVRVPIGIGPRQQFAPRDHDHVPRDLRRPRRLRRAGRHAHCQGQ